MYPVFAAVQTLTGALSILAGDRLALSNAMRHWGPPSLEWETIPKDSFVVVSFNGKQSPPRVGQRKYYALAAEDILLEQVRDVDYVDNDVLHLARKQENKPPFQLHMRSMKDFADELRKAAGKDVFNVCVNRATPKDRASITVSRQPVSPKENAITAHFPSDTFRQGAAFGGVTALPYFLLQEGLHGGVSAFVSGVVACGLVSFSLRRYPIVSRGLCVSLLPFAVNAALYYGVYGALSFIRP